MESWSVGDVSRFLLDIGLEMHVGDFRTQLADGEWIDRARLCTSSLVLRMHWPPPFLDLLRTSKRRVFLNRIVFDF